MTDPVSEARKACGCLFIAVDESIARDVQLKVDAAIDYLQKDLDNVRQESKQWKECYLAEKEKIQNITGKP